MQRYFEIEVEITLWDNDTTTAEKADTLLWVEHALTRTAEMYFSRGDMMVKLTSRWWGGFTAIVRWRDLGGIWDPECYLKTLCSELNYLHYWRREDEPIQMEWKIREV